MVLTVYSNTSFSLNEFHELMMERSESLDLSNGEKCLTGRFYRYWQPDFIVQSLLIIFM